MVVNYRGVDELKKNYGRKKSYGSDSYKVSSTNLEGVLSLRPPPPPFFLSSEAIVGLQYNLRSLGFFFCEHFRPIPQKHRLLDLERLQPSIGNIDI